MSRLHSKVKKVFLLVLAALLLYSLFSCSSEEEKPKKKKHSEEITSCDVPQCPVCPDQEKTICPGAKEETDESGRQRAFWVRLFRQDGTLYSEWIICTQPVMRGGDLWFKNNGEWSKIEPKETYRVDRHPTYGCDKVEVQ